jgi:hypothetical protein
MMIQQQEDTFVADHRPQRTTRIPGTTPVVAAMMVATVAALAVAMATVMTTPAFLPRTSAARP